MQEEFFYRAMRERESEIKEMNESMSKVNNIYQVRLRESRCCLDELSFDENNNKQNHYNGVTLSLCARA